MFPKKCQICTTISLLVDLEIFYYGTYGMILDGIFLDKLQFGGISFGSVQMLRKMMNVSRVWRAEFVRMIIEFWDIRCFFMQQIKNIFSAWYSDIILQWSSSKSTYKTYRLYLSKLLIYSQLPNRDYLKIFMRRNLGVVSREF